MLHCCLSGFDGESIRRECTSKELLLEIQGKKVTQMQMTVNVAGQVGQIRLGQNKAL